MAASDIIIFVQLCIRRSFFLQKKKKTTSSRRVSYGVHSLSPSTRAIFNTHAAATVLRSASLSIHLTLLLRCAAMTSLAHRRIIPSKRPKSGKYENYFTKCAASTGNIHRAQLRRCREFLPRTYYSKMIVRLTLTLEHQMHKTIMMPTPINHTTRYVHSPSLSLCVSRAQHFRLKFFRREKTKQRSNVHVSNDDEPIYNSMRRH